jgi:predicted 3-demethylubiquinone-9 3-methyltransferase (glyoxalase superfamily)
MERVMVCLMFRHEAEEAVNFYVSTFFPIFGNTKILKITYYGEDEIEALKTAPGITEDILPGPAGSVKSIRFLLCGQEILACNGGDFFGKFNESTSLYISCDTQEQIDLLWMALTYKGSEQPCGWLKDRFGVSWQIAPAIIQEIMESPDPAKAQRVMIALYRMKKIDLQQILEIAGR